MGKFNLNQLLNKASNGETGESENIRLPLKVISLNINDLIPSKENFYSTDNINELKTSIEMFGVLQNLTVKPIENGKYEIIAGHRRYKACKELFEEGKTEFEYLPCGIQGERDEIKEKILLIMTNSTVRELSDWEKMKQAEELRRNFEILKKRENLPGRVRDLVAEALNTSSTQVARLNAIENNLSNDFKSEFKDGKIGTSAAYELSGMSEEKQAAAFEEYKEKGGVKVDEIKEKKQQTEEYPKIAKSFDVPPNVSKSVLEKEAVKKLEGETKENTPPEQPDNFRNLEFEEFPETPDNISENEDLENDSERDFAELNEQEKAVAAIDFLENARFKLFYPGSDTRILDYIIDTLESVFEINK